jgi:hypothetical protein
VSLAAALSFYLNLNLLILIGVLGLLFVTAFIAKSRIRLSANEELHLHKMTALIVLTFSFAQPFFPSNEVFQPAAKVWSAQSIKSFSEEYKTSNRAGYLSLPTLNGSSTVKADSFALIWIALGIVIFFRGAFYLLRDLRRILTLRHRSFIVRKIGRVQVFVSDEAQVPFSYLVAA